MSTDSGGYSRTRPRKVIHATCSVHGGARGFTNLVVTQREGGVIELDPHATGQCVITLDTAAATALVDILQECMR